MRAHRKEVNDLVADLQRSGYLVEYGGSGHIKVRMSPERRVKLAVSGFDVDAAPALVSLPSTASDHRALRNARQMLRRIGYVS